MQCENLFCIYWAENECVLDDITLDIKGICQSCIYVNIQESDLRSCRYKALQKEAAVSQRDGCCIYAFLLSISFRAISRALVLPSGRISPAFCREILVRNGPTSS